jgi:TRAP transporter 4TM/12TM fusion protein
MADAPTTSRVTTGAAAAARVVLIGFALFQLYTSFTGMLEPLVQRGLFLGFGLGSVFLLAAAERTGWGKAPAFQWTEVLLALGGYWACFHVAFGNRRLSDFMVELGPLDMVLGVVAIVLVLEAARRTIGWFLPILSLAGLLYFYLGHDWITGAWQPPRVSTLTMIETVYASTETLFGYMTDMGTRVIAVFIVFGSLLLSTGATEIFIKLATLVAGRSWGGQAKVCTASSALFGTVTGSAVANVMALGPVTIPTMHRAGYTKSYAAAIEAVASAGGQIMPPVMGAGAFIMAEMLDIPYSSVVVAALIPAILYFMTIWFSVGFRARKMGIAPLARGEMPTARELLDPFTALPMYLPVMVLIGMLALDYTPTLAGVAAVVVLLGTLVVLRGLQCLVEGRRADLGATYVTLLRQILDGLYDGGRAIAMIAVLLACAAIVVKVLTATGAGVKVSSLILSLSGDNLVLVLILTAALAILLGMDVPTTASYILAAAVAAPIVVKLGVAPLNAHLFIFYFAILSAITPPVCASVFAAASIAKVNFWRVAGHAVVLAIGLYLIPFLFVFRTGVLMEGSWVQIAYDSTVTAIAIVAITAGSAGYFVRPLSWPLRLAMYAAAALLFYPAVWSDAAGLVAIATIGLVGLRREPPAAQATGTTAPLGRPRADAPLL